jgi:tetratricopeptide (TPR) repeat protein
MKSTRDTDTCPDASVLAAYVEGAVDARVRRSIETHIANCPECPIVVGETARLLSSSDDATDRDPMPLAVWWRLAAGAAAALCLPVIVWQIASYRDPLRATKRAAAESSTRRVEGRLDGFAYAPLADSRSAGPTKENFALQSEAARLNERGRTDATSLHARGVASLLAGDEAAAVQLLRASSRLESSNAHTWNDLAVAELEMARLDDARNIGIALTAANRAVTIDDGSAASHFTRAVILDRLGRRDDAARDYLRSAILDPGSPWSLEAVHRASRAQR